MSRVLQAALGMGKPGGRFEDEDLAKQVQAAPLQLQLQLYLVLSSQINAYIRMVEKTGSQC